LAALSGGSPSPVLAATMTTTGVASADMFSKLSSLHDMTLLRTPCFEDSACSSAHMNVDQNQMQPSILSSIAY